MQVQVKREKRNDYEEVDLLIKVTFEQETVAPMIKELRKADCFIPELAQIARINDQIIGMIMFSHVQIIKGKKSVESILLSPMAVLPAYQNLGIGSTLIRNSFMKARELGYQSVVVMGYEGFYPRFGFKPAVEYGIASPSGVADENFMLLELTPGSLSGVNGKVKCDALFDDIANYTT